MANFVYDAGITAALREADWETFMNGISFAAAGKLATAAGVTDVGADNDYDVLTDAAYTTLLNVTRGYYKNLK